ncbi:hypothetical protein F966_03114 [Acinetobacter higginsii]|uniref:Uncharacterized protein n=1 Tax=Acinetobacter higginsii TaxID=70347 RepID=N8XMZ9_9GAMM|nr:hypothetical protein F966_03114 [Acinetobacter higginsii]
MKQRFDLGAAFFYKNRVIYMDIDTYSSVDSL